MTKLVMLYVTRLAALVAYVWVALDASFIIRELQRATEWLIDSAELLFGIHPDYVVMANLIGLPELITFTLFYLLFLQLIGIVHFIATMLWHKVRELPKVRKRNT